MAPPAIASFVAAAKAHNITAMHALVDWALSGGPKMARALHSVDADQRASVAAAGWAELQDNVVSNRKLINRLNTLMLHLQYVTNVRDATTDERKAKLADLQVKAPQAHLPPEVVEGLNTILQQVKAISQVYVLETPQGAPLVVALSPDEQQLVLLD